MIYNLKQRGAVDEPQYPPFAYFNDVFSYSDFKKVLDISNNMLSIKPESGSVGSDDSRGTVDKNIRNSTVSWLNFDTDNAWFFERIIWIINHLNDRFYKMDLCGFESFQVTEYTGSEKQFYNYHTDSFCNSNSTMTRKLSCVLFLSNKKDYEGGEFELLSDSITPNIIEQKENMLIVFPSYQIHRVTPVTSGTRRSIVTWCNGPHFK